MRATPLLAAVAAGLLSFSADAQEGRPKQDAPAAAQAAAPPAPTVIVSVPTNEASDKVPSAPQAATAVVPTASSPKPADTPAAAVRKPAAPTLTARIDLSRQRLQLTYDGRQQESWPISSGREGYATPRGVFRPQWASKMWYSRKYDNAPMPHAVFFSGGVAVHGTQALGSLGSPASHGCVRLAPANAARFYALVHKHGFASTRIEVFGTPPAPRIARREAPHREQQARSAGQRSYGSTYQPPVRYQQGWMPPSQQSGLRRGSNGLVYLPAGSPHRGQQFFVHNGVTYMRVR